MNISLVEQERAIDRSRRRYQTDLVSNFITSYENGLKAKEQGRIEETIRIARNALKLGFPLEQIIAVTGLTEEEVEHLHTRT